MEKSSSQFQHYFLGSTDRWNWDEDFSILLYGFVYYADESTFDPFAVRHDVVWSSIGAFDDQCLSSRELSHCGVQHHSSSELEVGTVDDVVEAFTNVEIHR